MTPVKLMDWEPVKVELAKKLDPAFVRPAPAGKYGDYIEGVHVIYEANRIFGFDGWSYSTDRLQLTNEEHQGDGKHRVGYLAIVTVNVDGVRRSDVGHGQGFGKSLGDAHDSAVKEAVTDALKRALRTFGNPFGLALYEKSKANVGVDFDAAAAAEVVKGKIRNTKTMADLQSVFMAETHRINEIGAEDASLKAQIIALKDQRKQELERAA